MSLSVLIVSPLPPPYGGISHWSSLIKAYAEKVGGVKLFWIDIAPRWRASHSLNLYIRMFGGLFQLMRDFLFLLIELFRFRIRVVHLTTSGQLALARDFLFVIACRLFRVPLVYHLRFGRVSALSDNGGLEWVVISRIMSLSSLVIAIDRATLDSIRTKLPGVNLVLVPNCVDVDYFTKFQVPASEGKRALFLGWVIPTKGVEELISAWTQLDTDGWVLDIVGPISDDYRSALVSLIGQSQVNILGAMSHDLSMQKMAECDLFILPSYTEGFPNVILEAMVLGKAIVATSVGAIPEMLADGSGVVIPPKDPEAIRLEITRLIGNGDLRESLGERAKMRVYECYSLKKVYADYVHIWSSF